MSTRACRTRRSACQQHTVPCSAELESTRHHFHPVSTRPLHKRPGHSTANMAACPSIDACLLLADVLQTISGNTGSIDRGAGVPTSSAKSKVSRSEELVRRQSRVTQEAADEVENSMFLSRAGGPHPSGIPCLEDFPTPEEICAGQAAVKAAIGEKGSEQRARAAQLADLGMIAREEALGYWLSDRFRGAFPSSPKAFLIGKRAAERLAGAKEKQKWKEKARQARKQAEKRGADGDAVAAEGQQAAATARAIFEPLCSMGPLTLGQHTG